MKAINTRTNKTYKSLQEAIDDAEPRDTIHTTGDIDENFVVNKPLHFIGTGGKKGDWYFTVKES